MNNENKKTFYENEEYFRKIEDDLTFSLPEGNYFIIRIDGRNFSKLTRKFYEKPHDDYFKKIMIETTKFTMENCGIPILFAYTQSDEISFIINKDARAYALKMRKWLSIVPSIASAFFTFKTGHIVSFDARVLIVSKEEIIDYVSWRSEDSYRNCINNYAFYALYEDDKELNGKNQEQKLELLKERGIDFDEVNNDIKYGSIVYYMDYLKKAYNKISGKEVFAQRRVLTHKPSNEMLKKIDDLLKEEC